MGRGNTRGAPSAPIQRSNLWIIAQAPHNNAVDNVAGNVVGTWIMFTRSFSGSLVDVFTALKYLQNSGDFTTFHFNVIKPKFHTSTYGLKR
jgi:hypothetical protein